MQTDKDNNVQRTPSRRKGVVYNHVLRMRSEAAAKDASNRSEIKEYIWGDKLPEINEQTQDEIAARVYEILKKDESAVLEYFGQGQGGSGLAKLPKDVKSEFESIIGAQVRRKSCAPPNSTGAAAAGAATRSSSGGT